MDKLERDFQKDLIKDLKKEFEPDCIIIKNDAQLRPGIPDISIFKGNKWAALECKKSKNASHRPNQDYYVNKMNSMSFCRFIYPENKEEVINELKVHFQ